MGLAGRGSDGLAAEEESVRDLSRLLAASNLPPAAEVLRKGGQRGRSRACDGTDLDGNDVALDGGILGLESDCDDGLDDDGLRAGRLDDDGFGDDGSRLADDGEAHLGDELDGVLRLFGRLVDLVLSLPFEPSHQSLPCLKTGRNARRR